MCCSFNGKKHHKVDIIKHTVHKGKTHATWKNITIITPSGENNPDILEIAV